MATIRALSAYKHADHFNKRVVEKVKHETTDEKAEAQKETATVVKEIQAKAATEEVKTPVEAKPEVKAEAKVEKKADKPAAKKVIKK